MPRKQTPVMGSVPLPWRWPSLAHTPERILDLRLSPTGRWVATVRSVAHDDQPEATVVPTRRLVNMTSYLQAKHTLDRGTVPALGLTWVKVDGRPTDLDLLRLWLELDPTTWGLSDRYRPDRLRQLEWETLERIDAHRTPGNLRTFLEQLAKAPDNA